MLFWAALFSNTLKIANSLYATKRNKGAVVGSMKLLLMTADVGN